MSPMQRFVTSSQQAPLAKRHRRQVFRARIISAFSGKNMLAVMIHAGLIVFYLFIAVALFGVAKNMLGGSI